LILSAAGRSASFGVPAPLPFQVNFTWISLASPFSQ
jgi:hypothetical protein